MIHAVKFKQADDTTKILENVVAIELLRQKKDFYYYFTANNKEVNFLIRQGPQTQQLIQVSYDISNPQTKKREIRALTTAANELHCNDLTILTWPQKGTEVVDKKEIKIIPVWEWFLKQNRVHT